jgi:hypothetical protein
MRRATLVAVLSLSIVALGGAAVSAHGPGRPPVTPTFAARAGTASQGGYLRVGARVNHAKWCAPFSASAVVHFAAADDVTVTLIERGRRCDRRGHSAGIRYGHRRGVTRMARAWVPVGPTETPGEVPVDVTIVFDGQTVQLQATGLILGTEPEEEPAGEEPPDQIG